MLRRLPLLMGFDLLPRGAANAHFGIRARWKISQHCDASAITVSVSFHVRGAAACSGRFYRSCASNDPILAARQAKKTNFTLTKLVSVIGLYSSGCWRSGPNTS
ncbi:hypothetical protein SK3146_04900 [Paenibacillus konkukensis]|uniref:Secreted protein n=1 Tax=Paenibacillus konkukensis TaxID=2020716 RepID=A0ABY4RSQ8_9BACL|nr:hypothetical protein SK3146_04900 [Paenibacillus konkukensis]